jgi:hypothetical protein
MECTRGGQGLDPGRIVAQEVVKDAFRVLAPERTVATDSARRFREIDRLAIHLELTELRVDYERKHAAVRQLFIPLGEVLVVLDSARRHASLLEQVHHVMGELRSCPLLDEPIQFVLVGATGKQ